MRLVTLRPSLPSAPARAHPCNRGAIIVCAIADTRPCYCVAPVAAPPAKPHCDVLRLLRLLRLPLRCTDSGRPMWPCRAKCAVLRRIAPYCAVLRCIASSCVVGQCACCVSYCVLLRLIAGRHGPGTDPHLVAAVVPYFFYCACYCAFYCAFYCALLHLIAGRNGPGSQRPDPRDAGHLLPRQDGD